MIWKIQSIRRTSSCLLYNCLLWQFQQRNHKELTRRAWLFLPFQYMHPFTLCFITNPLVSISMVSWFIYTLCIINTNWFLPLQLIAMILWFICFICTVNTNRFHPSCWQSFLCPFVLPILVIIALASRTTMIIYGWSIANSD